MGVGRGEEDFAELEEGDRSGASRHVVRDRVQEARQHGWSQLGLLLAERVLDRQQVVVAHTHPCDVVGVDEGETDRLVEPGARQRRHQLASAALGDRQTAGRAGGQRCLELVVTVDSCDLLDDVCGPCHVGAKTGNRYVHRVVPVNLHPESLQDRRHAGRRESGSQDSLHFRDRQLQLHRSGRCWMLVDRPFEHFPTRPSRHEGTGSLVGDVGQFWVDSTLESGGCLGPEIVTPPHPHDGRRVPRSSLHEDPGRGARDLAPGTAHGA